MTATDRLKTFPWSTLGRREPFEDFSQKISDQKKLIPLFKTHPNFTLLFWVDETTDISDFERCVSALQLQSYPYWEAFFISRDKLPVHRSFVFGQKDSRLHWKDEPSNRAPQESLGSFALKSKGEWFAFLDPKCVLSPIALTLFARALQDKASVDLLYANEVTVNEDRSSVHHYFSKPAFSWFDLIHFNYLGSFWFVRRSCFESLDGFQAADDPEHDFLLRLYERTKAFKLIPSFLYYRPQEAKSVATSVKVVREHLDRLGFEAEVQSKDQHLQVTPKITEPDKYKVSAIICFKDQAGWTLRCLRDLVKQQGKIPLEVFLVNNQSKKEELALIRAALPEFKVPVQLIDYDKPFNFSDMHNWATEKYCQGTHLLMVNNDVFWHGTKRLDELVAWANQAWVGTVGIKLLYPDGRVQHGGFRGVFGGFSRMARIHHIQREEDFISDSREVFGNTFATCLVRKELYESIGGLRALDYPNGHSDVAFNFECLKRGMKNIYLGQVQATHLESGSRGITYEYWEECGIEREYPEILQQMLRQDLGFDRVPNEKISLKQFIKSGLAAKLMENSWLAGMRPRLKEWASKILAET